MESSTSATPPEASQNLALQTLAYLEEFKERYQRFQPGDAQDELTVHLQHFLCLAGYRIKPAEETPATLLDKLDDYISVLKDKIGKAAMSGPAARPPTPAPRPATPASPPRITLPLR